MTTQISAADVNAAKGVNTTLPAMLPPGTYSVTPREIALGRASTGTKQAGVRLEVVEGPFKGYEIVAYLYFTDATTERSFDSLEAMGWDCQSFETLFDTVPNSGRIVQAKVKHEEYQGEIKAKVDRIIVAGKVDGIAISDKLDAEDPRLQAFAAELDGALMKRQQKATAAAAGAAAPKLGAPGLKVGGGPLGSRPSAAPGANVPGMGDDDDIPF